MATVSGRNVSPYNIHVFNALVCFTSRIVLRKIDSVAKSTLRKVEGVCKKYIKANADLRYLKLLYPSTHAVQ